MLVPMIYYNKIIPTFLSRLLAFSLGLHLPRYLQQSFLCCRVQILLVICHCYCCCNEKITYVFIRKMQDFTKINQCRGKFKIMFNFIASKFYCLLCTMHSITLRILLSFCFHYFCQNKFYVRMVNRVL